MLLIALTCLRADEAGADLMNAILRGEMETALTRGQARLQRQGNGSPQSRALVGQLMGRCLLALGREAQAEELFQHQLKTYESLSRTMVRWMSSLDRGMLCLTLNRLGRSAEHFNAVGDDTAAPVDLRIEALAGMAVALHRLGEYRRAARTLLAARRLAEPVMSPRVLDVLEAIEVEMTVLQNAPGLDAGRESVDRMPATDLPARLAASMRALSDLPLCQERLRFLGALADGRRTNPGYRVVLLDGLRWMRDAHLSGYEEEMRVEATLAFVEDGDRQRAATVLGPIAADDQQVQRHRYVNEIRYCLSRLHALEGRHAEAFQLFRTHASHALQKLRIELAQVPYSYLLDKQELADHDDAMRLQLPLRYRKAYDFIVERLDHRDLSIREVAAHVEVTERALQMAFRSHLGMTPAEMVRRKRAEHVRADLQRGPSHGNLMQVATRWGMGNRSTLAHNYRQRFDVTPTDALR